MIGSLLVNSFLVTTQDTDVCMCVCCVQPNRYKHAITTQKHMNNICSRDTAVRDQLKKCVDELLQVNV